MPGRFVVSTVHVFYGTNRVAPSVVACPLV